MRELSEMLAISPGKVMQIILHSKGIEAKTEAWNKDAVTDVAAADADKETILEDLPIYATRHEILKLLEALNRDEQASLIALAWIGRGTYAPDEIGEAISTAKAEHGFNAPAYLLTLPLLPDYLEDALEQFGISTGDTENKILRPEDF